jgi:hypothetical protein
MGGLIDFISGAGPVALALMGVAVAVWSPKQRKAHWTWGISFALVGALTVSATWKQARDSDKAQGDLTNSVNELKLTIDKLTIPVKQTNGLDPDSIYQNGGIVGHVIAPRITLNQSRVYFEQLQNAGNLDRGRTFEYRDYILKMLGAGGYTGMLITPGEVANSVYTNFVAEIVGHK